jgi:hypothetical protein
MKVYYIFKIKDDIVNLYKDTPSVLYNILKTIYYLEKEEVDYGYNLFNQLIVPIPKNKLDRSIFIELHQDIPYSKRRNVHYINNLYRNEISRLEINNTYIRLEQEQNYSSFYKILNKELDNLFFCSFKNIDFFFLKDYLEDKTCFNKQF